MPEKPLNPDENRFARGFVRHKGDIPKAERFARIKKGEGVKFYRRWHVREEIDRQQEMIRQEQAKIDAHDIDRREETLEELLGPELIKAIKLDAEKYGHIKLKAIAMGLVVTGKIRQGNTEALDRNPPQSQGANVSIYTSVFERQQAHDASGRTIEAQKPASNPSDAPQTLPAPPPPPQERPAFKIRVY